MLMPRPRASYLGISLIRTFAASCGIVRYVAAKIRRNMPQRNATVATHRVRRDYFPPESMHVIRSALPQLTESEPLLAAAEYAVVNGPFASSVHQLHEQNHAGTFAAKRLHSYSFHAAGCDVPLNQDAELILYDTPCREKKGAAIFLLLKPGPH